MITSRRILVFILLILSNISLSAQTADQIFSQGQNAFNDKLYSNALSSFDRFLKNYPENPRSDAAKYMSGICWFQMESYERAYSIFSSFDSLYPSSGYRRRTNYWQGLTLWKLENFTEAIEAFERQLEWRLDSYYYQRSLLYLGYCQEKLNNFEEAAAYYTELNSIADGSEILVESLLRQGIVDLDLGNYRAALSAFQKILFDFSYHEKSRDISFFLGESYYHLGQHEDAKERLQNYINSESTIYNENALYRIGWILYDSEQYENAITHLEEYLENYPQAKFKIDANQLIADCYLALGDVEEARDQFSELTEKLEEGSDDLQTVNFNMGQTYIANENDSEALIWLEKALIGPDRTLTAEAHYLRGKLFFRLNREDEGLAEWETLYRDYPESDFREEIAKVMIARYSDRGDIESQKRVLNSLVSDYPNTEDGEQYLLLLGEIADNENDSTTAIAAYSQLTRDFPESEYYREALYRIGYHYSERNEHIRASEYFKTIVDIAIYDELHEKALYNLGVSYYFGSENNLAITTFNQFTDSFDASEYGADAAYFVGTIYLEENDYSRAANWFQDSADLAEDEDKFLDALFMAGSCYYNSGSYRDAITRFDEIYNDYRDSSISAKSKYYSAMSQYKLGELSDSYISFENASQMNNQNVRIQSLYQMVAILIEQGENSKALSDIEDMIEEFPTTTLPAGLLFQEGDRLFGIEEYQNAIEWFELCIEYFATDNLAMQSELRIALSQYYLGNVQKAKDLLVEYILANPNDSSLSIAMDALSEIVIDEKDVISSENLYFTLQREVGENSYLIQLYLAIVRINGFQSNRIVELEKVVNNQNLPDDIRNEALLLSGITYQQSGNDVRALDIYSSVISRSSNQIGAEALFLTAEIAKKTDFNKAAEEYLNVAYLYSNESEWAPRALYEAWRVYFYELEDKNTADIIQKRLERDWAGNSWSDKCKTELSLHNDN